MKWNGRCLALTFAVTCSIYGYAAATDNSQTANDQPGKPNLTADEILNRLEVKGEVYILDASGKRLLGAPARTNFWRLIGKNPRTMNWGSSDNFGHLFLHQSWDIRPDGSIHVILEEYDRQEDDPKSGSFKQFRGLLKKEELTIENFAPIIWKVQSSKDTNMVLRLTPSLREEANTRDLTQFPVSGKNVVVTDSLGYSWADETSFSGVFVGMKTHRGLIAFSFQPFKGAKEVGLAKDHEIELKLAPNLTVKMRSETGFLPPEVSSKVYGIYLPEKKSSSPSSVSTFDTGKEERFLKNIYDRP